MTGRSMQSVSNRYAVSISAFRLALITACAMCVIAVLPAGANAAFDVNGFAVTPSSTTKSANPDVVVSFTRSGSPSEDLKSFDFHFAAGLTVSTAAIPKCSETDLKRDRCPASSLVGTIGADARLDSLGISLRDIPGSIYALPNAGGAQRIGIALRPSGFGVVMGIQTLTPGSPVSSGVKASVGNVTRSMYLLGLFPVDITFNAVTFKYSGKGNADETIVTNPSACVPATTTLNASSWQNVSKTRTSTFTPTGCVTPPTVAITAPTESSTTSASVNVAFTVNGGMSIPSDVTCNVNGLGTTNTQTNSVALSLGANTITVTCENAGGTGSESRSITREPVVIPPAGVRISTFAAPSTGLSGGGPAPATTPGPAPSISFDISEGSATSFQCQLVGVTTWGPCTTSTATSGTWTIPTGGLTDGTTYEYQVRAMNGTLGGAPATGYFINDSRQSAATAVVTAKPNAITPGGQEMQAGRHPDVEAQVNLVGWDDPASLNVKFPDGLMGSLAAVPPADRCTLVEANAGACPASSRIGSISGVGVSSRDGSLTAAGSIYLVRPEDVPSQYAAGVAVNLSADNVASQDLGDVRAIGYIGVRNELQPGAPARTYDAGRNMFVTFPNIPNSTATGTGTETRVSARRFHVTQATFTLDGVVGSTGNPETNRPLVTNPHYCGTQFPAGTWNRPDQKRFVGVGTGYNGTVLSSFTSQYAVTCTTQAFSPSFDMQLKEVADASWTASKPPSTKVMLKLGLSLPDEALTTPNATIARAAVQLPPSISTDLTNLGSGGDLCGLSTAYPSVSSAGYTAFVPGTNPSIPGTYCPPSSIVGSARFESPLFPDALIGRIYAINVTAVPHLGIWIDPSVAPTNPQGVSIGLFARLNAGATADEGVDGIQTIQMDLNSLPDIPVTGVELTIGDNPDRGQSTTGTNLEPTIFKTVGSTDVGCRPSPGDLEEGIPEYPDPWNAIARFRPYSNIGTSADMSSALFVGAGNPVDPKDFEGARIPIAVTGCDAHF